MEESLATPNIEDTQKVYTEISNSIKDITESFDGSAEHTVEILLKMSHSITRVFNELLQTIGWLSEKYTEELQTLYGAITDIEISLLQIIQSLSLAGSSFSLHTKEVLDLNVTIGMAIQDQASALSSMIAVISDIIDSNGSIPESIGLAALLQTVINVTGNILGFSTNILVSINGQVSSLHTNMINYLTKANAEIIDILQNYNMNDTTLNASLSTALNDVDVDLITIWSEKSFQMFDIDEVVDGLADTLNCMTTSLTSVGVTVDPLLIDSINNFQKEIISLTDGLSEISKTLDWIPNSGKVAAINVITSVNAIIVSLKDLLSATDTQHFADIFEAQLSSIADTLNTLIYAVSRQIDNAFTSVLSSENLLGDLQSLVPIVNSLADELQGAVRVSFIVLDRALNAVVSVENLTWTPEDATALTDILSVLQHINGRTLDTNVDVNMYPSIVALLDTSQNAAGAFNMVDNTVDSILSLYE